MGATLVAVALLFGSSAGASAGAPWAPGLFAPEGAGSPGASGAPGLHEITHSVVAYKTIDGTELQLLVWRPTQTKVDDRLPAIVFFHGGGWSGGEAELFGPQAQYLAARGMVAISVGYRTEGPVIADEDGVDAWNFIHDHAAELRVEQKRMVAAGGSAGGQMALATGFLDLPNTDPSKRPAAIAVTNPVSNTTANYPAGYGRNRFTSDETARTYSPFHGIEPGRPPLLILHGTSDTTVHLRNSIDFVTAMREAGNDATLVTYNGIGHGFYNRQAERYNRYFYETTREMDAFLQRLGFLSGPQLLRPEPSDLLHNGGFEASLSQWSADEGTGATVATSGEQARTGRAAAVVDPGADASSLTLGQDVTDEVRVSGQGEYLMRAWVKPLADARRPVTMSLSIRLEGDAAAKTYALPATSAGGGRWIEVAGTAATKFEGAVAEARLSVNVAGAGSPVAIDDVSLKYLPARTGAWSFAQNPGTRAVDTSGFGHDGTVTDAAWQRGGHGGGHLNFADAGRVEIPKAVDPRRDFRVSAWVRLDSTATGDQILLTQKAATAEPWLYVPAGTTNLATGLGGSPLVGNVALPVGDWVQVTVMRGDGLLRLYVGDQLAGASTRSAANVGNAWVLGSPGTLPGTQWHGGVASLEAYDYADNADGALVFDAGEGYVAVGDVHAGLPLRGGQLQHVSVPVSSTLPDAADVSVSLQVPSGWTTEPVVVSVPAGGKAVAEVPITAPAAPTTATLTADATAGSALVLGGQTITVVTTPSPAVASLALDSGDATSPVLAGYERLAPEDAWASGRTFGWVGTAPDTRDRAVLDDLRRDFTMSTRPTTVRVQVPAGRHEVHLLTGDASFAAGQLVVTEGSTSLADTGRSLAAGEFAWLGFALDGGAEGRTVDLTLSVVGSGNWRLSALTILK